MEHKGVKPTDVSATSPVCKTDFAYQPTQLALFPAGKPVRDHAPGDAQATLIGWCVHLHRVEPGLGDSS